VDIPAEIWRRNAHQVSKLIVSDKALEEVVLDPEWEIADADIHNNYYPRRIIPSRVEAYKSSQGSRLVDRDIMQDIKTELNNDDEEE